MRLLEEWTPGERIAIGSAGFPADEIIAFASRYDPQYFHTDPDAARASLLGGLCASGWHTCAVYMKLLVAWSRALAAERAARGQAASPIGPQPGIDDLVWPRPVYAGDMVHYAIEAVETRPLASRPGWGLLRLKVEGTNQDGAQVLGLIDNIFVERRR